LVFKPSRLNASQAKLRRSLGDRGYRARPVVFRLRAVTRPKVCPIGADGKEAAATVVVQFENSVLS
jgi:hypothetical protein